MSNKFVNVLYERGRTPSAAQADLAGSLQAMHANSKKNWVMVSPEGFEPSYFVPPRAQNAAIGTYAQQVVTRVAGYSWC